MVFAQEITPRFLKRQVFDKIEQRWRDAAAFAVIGTIPPPQPCQPEASIAPDPPFLPCAAGGGALRAT